MPKFNKDRHEIEMLSSAYMNSKRILKEYHERTISCSAYTLECNQRIVRHIENVAHSLEENERHIIVNEVIEGKRGKWYLSYTSAPTYYRDRKKAYANFLRCL